MSRRSSPWPRGVASEGFVSIVVNGRSLYVVMGAAVAGLASAASRSTNPDVTLLVVPAMYFVYVYYRMHIVRAVLESISSVSQENEAVLAGASHGR